MMTGGIGKAPGQRVPGGHNEFDSLPGGHTAPAWNGYTGAGWPEITKGVPTVNPWEGKHIWIWELDQSGPVDRIMSQAVALGLAGVLVKGWDGASFWPQLGQISLAAHQAGLVVGAWGYSYGRDPAGEAAAARQALAVGADWLVIDTEAEYEAATGAAMAGELKAAFQSKIGSQVPVAYSSFALPAYHPAFPFAAFEWCNAALPQVYWADFGMAPASALTACLGGYRAFGLPVAPVGQIYGQALPADIETFLQTAADAGCPGVSFFDWQGASAANLAAVGVLAYEAGVNPLPQQWQANIVKQALAAGLIKQYHEPDAQAPVWFVLQVALNALAAVGKNTG